RGPGDERWARPPVVRGRRESTARRRRWRRRRAPGRGPRLAGLEADEVARREPGEEPEEGRQLVLARDAVVLRPRDGDHLVVARLAVDRDAHARIGERLVVPRPRPVVGGHVQI